jgi:hypothetical protein
MGIDFPSSLSASAGQKFTYSGQEYEFNGTAWKKVRDKVTSFNGATGAIVGVTSVQGKTGDVTLTDLEITHGVETFNGLSGSIDTTSLTLPVAGISGPSAITFDNGEVIRNSPDGSIQIIPSDEGGNHFGIEIDATEWGFGPVINVIDESGTQVTKAIRLDTDITLSNTNVPDGTPARLMFGNASDRGLQQNNNGDGTIGMGVNGDNGHFAVIRKADLSDGDRSMSTSDKTALGMSNPQFLVYSADQSDANDYLRIEHDQTNGNIFSGNGGINLVPSNGAVGISGGDLSVGGKIKATTGITLGAGGITFADGTFQDTAARAGLKYTVTSGTPSAGEIYLGIDLSTVIDLLILHDTDAHGNDISGILSLFADNGGYIQVLKDDGSALIGVAVDATETSVATFGSDKLTIQQVNVDFEIEEQVPSTGDTVYIDINPSLVSAVQSIGGSNSWNKGTMQLANGLTAHNLGGIGVGYLQVETSAILFSGSGEGTQVSGITFSDDTNQTTAAKTDIDVATFTISASSAITTGKKTNSLYRIPHDATLTNVDVKVSDTGGFTAGAFIAGGDFGDPTVGSLTGATLGVAGLTGSSSSFNITTVTGGNFLMFDVINNDSGSTQAQMFVSYERR